jgi:hypothetical protein
MRLRNLLPLVGMLALGACKDEKKAENPAPPASTTAPATPTPPATNANPAPATKPAGK